MLEVLNLTKVYKSKGGVEVRALDGVSLRFPERGMVFLLGKSGSGKSTLLNVCGGLDAPTSGEIIVKGRSSRDFTQSDFDSYRNTFIGFIFQEYNILNEFSVEDNIALALELQGKSKDKAAVAALLEQVDLTGYAKRKPNTLSGGQKQRIAIARALIKSPEIIMADEPTGALDSNTGKQVFDTLKKLSRDKLVIIVSHDRDFAEQYGDRIIELKDGKILSDVSKTIEEQKAISENVTAIGDTLCIKRGTRLTEGDFDKIKAFLSTAENDVVIAGGEREVEAFRAVTRITDEGGQEVFRDTDENTVEKKTYKPEESRFIRSKLPLRHAAKIGLSGLKTKPFRLFFTTLLCTVAFVLFGLLSTLTFYDSEATFRETLSDSDLPLLKVSKHFKTTERTYEYGEFVHEYEYTGNVAKFSKAELDALAATLGTVAFPICNANINFSAQQQSMYWMPSINCFAALGGENGVVGETLAGKYPTADNEIMISDYLADALINTKAYLASGDQLSINRREDLIGKEFAMDLSYNSDENKHKIVGIFKGPEIPAKFDTLKEGGDSSLRYELSEWLLDGTALLAIVTEDKMDAIVERFSYNYSYFGDAFTNREFELVADNTGGEDDGPHYDYQEMGAYASVEHLPTTGVHYFDENVTTLGAGQAIVRSQYLYERLRNVIWEKLDELNSLEGGNLYDRYSFNDAYNAAYTLRSPLEIMDRWLEGFYNTEYVPQAGLEDIYNAFKSEFFDEANGILYEKYNTSFYTECQKMLTDAGIDADTANNLWNNWLNVIWNPGMQAESPSEGDAAYPAYRYFLEFYDEVSEYNSMYWDIGVSTKKFEYIVQIDEAIGEKYIDFDHLMVHWEKTYADTDSVMIPSGLDTLYEEWRTAYEPRYQIEAKREYYNTLSSLVDVAIGNGLIYDEETDGFREPTAEERSEAGTAMLEFYRTLGAEDRITFKFRLYNPENGSAFGDTYEYTPIGVYDDTDGYGLRLYIPAADADAYWQAQMVLRAYVWESTTRYEAPADAIYENAFIIYDNTNTAMVDALTKLYVERDVYDDNDVSYVLSSSLAENFGMVDSMVSEFSKIFLYVGLVLAVFAALLLSNFISVSISYKRREIGILRAVGARSLDVFKIFFSESFFITALCVMLSLVGSVVICSVINAKLVEMLGASLFVFGILSIAVLVGVALLTAVVATFLPVYNAAKKKPVEAIRAL